jgi:hypothetical protein
MRASALCLAAAAAVISFGGTPAQATAVRADGILAALPALDMTETVLAAAIGMRIASAMA